MATLTTYQCDRCRRRLDYKHHVKKITGGQRDRDLCSRCIKDLTDFFANKVVQPQESEADKEAQQ